MENMTELEETTTAEAYEPPALVAVGDFSEDTLGFGSRYTDVLGQHL